MPRGLATSQSTQIQPTISPKLWLLLVGVNQYLDEQLPCLRYSAVDCQVLAEALTSATQELFTQKEIKIFHDFAAQLPLLDTVRDNLQQITNAAQPSDTILFYFSGHGMLQPSTQQAFLCLADTQKDNLQNTGLAVKELLQLLGNSGVQNQLVWLDACHSGGMSLRNSGDLLNPTPQLLEVLQQRAAKSKGFYALLSCDTDQQSWEFPELGHGVFTYYLMRGLCGDAADTQGVISADGLYRYVYHQTLQYIDKTNQQLRLINQQKRGKGDTQLYSEYPLQTPKRIVEGIGELILGAIPAIAQSLPPRTALVIEGISNSQTALDFSKVLAGAGVFELEYLPRSGTTTAKEIRETIKQCLRVTSQPQRHNPEEPATVLLYLRGRLQETPSGEAALVLLDDIWLSRSWLRQQLRRSQITQQIIILDCPVGAQVGAYSCTPLQEWVEDLQLAFEKGQCIIAAAFAKDNPELFAQALINTLKAVSQPDGLSVAAWISQLQVYLAAQIQSLLSPPLYIWLSGTQGVIEIIPAIAGVRSHKTAALDLRICPYRGLKAFNEEDAQYFYGRESLTQQLIAQLAHKSFLAVVGASGSGKSSVVQAGLITQLRLGKQLPGSDSWLVRSLRPGARPLEALARRLGEGRGAFEQGSGGVGGAGGAGEAGGAFEQGNSGPPRPKGVGIRGNGGAGEDEGVISTSPHPPIPSSPHLLLEGMLYQGVEGFVYWVRSRPEPMVVLVIDQFEELFTLAPSEDRQRFLELMLGAIAYACDKFKLVITVRADFIASCLEIPALATLLQESSVLVPPKLSDEDYRRVIVNPAEQVGLKVESGLVEVLLQELNYSAGDLPLLEFVLEQLWEFRQEGELTLAAYQQQIGGIKGALERKAQEVYESLDSQAQDCARWIFLSLTQLGEGTEDTRRRVLKSELVVKKYAHDLVERTLLALTAAKLIVVNLEEELLSRGVGEQGSRGVGEQRSRGDKGEISTSSPPSPYPPISPTQAVTIEVAHEILIRHWSTLRWWLEENRSRLRLTREIEQAAALWKHNHEQPDFLLHGVRLAEAEDIYVKYTDELSVDVQCFIAACLEARQQQQLEQKKRLRQAQRAVIIISILGIAASGFGGFAYLQKQAAQLREIAALNASSEAFLFSNQQLEAVISSVKAAKELKQVFSPPKEIQITTAATLQQAINQTQELNRLQNHSQQVNSINFSPDGQFIASASDDKTIKLWHSNGKLITAIAAAKNRVTKIAFSPDGKFIAASADKIIQLYPLDTACIKIPSCPKVINANLIKIFTGHTDIVTDLTFSPDGKVIASASLDKTIKLWRVDGTLIKSWNAHDGWVNTLSFSPNGKTIASGGEDNMVKLWQVQDGKLIKNLAGHQGRITRVKFSHDGKTIASSSGDKTIKLWNVEGQVLHSLEGDSEQVNTISFSPDSQIVAAADRNIKIWQLDGTLLKTIKGHGEQIRDVSFSPNGKIIASASADKTIRLWKLDNQSIAKNDIQNVIFSSNGKTFVSIGWDGSITIWQQDKIAKASILIKFQVDKSIIDTLDFSQNGKVLAIANSNKNIQIWDIQNQKLIKTLTGHHDRITSIIFSPDNQIIASASADKTIKLWRVVDGKLLQTLHGHSDEVTSVSFSPDGKLLASGSVDNTVKVWQVDGNLVKTLTGHGLAIASVKFSPDGKTLASASWDNTIKLWNVTDGKLINTLSGHTDGVTSLSFSADGEILASASADSTIKLWSMADNTLLKTLLGHPQKVNSISFSADSKFLLSTGENTGVMLWNLNLDDLMQQGCSRITDYLQNNPNASGLVSQRLCS